MELPEETRARAQCQLSNLQNASSQRAQLEAAVAHETEDASYSWGATLDGNALTIIERFSMKSQRVPPERYPALRELLRELEATQSASIHVELQP